MSSAATERSKAQCGRMREAYAEQDARQEAHLMVMSKKKRVTYEEVEGNGGNETNVWPPAFSDDVDNDNRSEAHEHADDEVNEDSYWPSSQDDTSTGTPSSSSLSDGSEEDEPIKKTKVSKYMYFYL
jgi:hypothetical protein